MKNKHKGYLGEIIAIIFLFFKGYKIIKWRYKNKLGEIDIIAMKKNTICFIEVKSRKNQEKCHIAIKLNQLQRIQRSSMFFLKKNMHFQPYDIRYDVILIANFTKLQHIINISQ